jgi:hypothetical protein
MGAALTDREQGLLVTGGRQRLGQSRRFEADNSFWGLTTVWDCCPRADFSWNRTQPAQQLPRCQVISDLVDSRRRRR